MDTGSTASPVVNFTATAVHPPPSLSTSSISSRSTSTPTAQSQKPLYKPFSAEEHSRFLAALDSLFVPSFSFFSTSPATEKGKQQAWTGLEWSELTASVGNGRSVMEVKLHAHECFLRLQAVMGAPPEPSLSLPPALSAGQEEPQPLTEEKEEGVGENEEVGEEAATPMEEQQQDEEEVEEDGGGKKKQAQQVEQAQQQKEKGGGGKTETHEEGQGEEKKEKNQDEGETGRAVLPEKEEEENAPAGREVEVVVAMITEVKEPHKVMMKKEEDKKKEEVVEKKNVDNVLKEEKTGVKRKAGDQKEEYRAVADASAAAVFAKSTHKDSSCSSISSNDIKIEEDLEGSLSTQEQKEKGAK